MEEDDSHALLETLFSEIIAIVESYDDLLVSLSNDDQMKSDYILHLVKCRTIVYSAALATLNEYCWKDASMRGDMRWQQMIEIAFWTPQEVGINLECYDTSHRKGSKSGYRIEQQMHYDANSRIHRRSWCSIL